MRQVVAPCAGIRIGTRQPIEISRKDQGAWRDRKAGYPSPCSAAALAPPAKSTAPRTAFRQNEIKSSTEVASSCPSCKWTGTDLFSYEVGAIGLHRCKHTDRRDEAQSEG